MGIFLNMAISKSVTKQEWQDVYKETLQLVNAFPFAERREIPIRGIPTICLVRTKEREETYGWHNEKTKTGWFADGDYEFLNTAEEYFLPKDLVEESAYEEDAPDALLFAVPAYLEGYNWKDPGFQHCYRLWDEKTQGKPYHMYLLAVACLIESRLGSKAYVYGDITRGQCERAVRMANEHLDKKIHTPDRCDPDRLFIRIADFPLSEGEKLKLYTSLYLGNQDGAFGKRICDHFSEAACDEYWQRRFGHYQISMRGFHNALEDYLLWGFDLEKLCAFIQGRDEEGHEHYEDFVKIVMDAKLHHKEKDCRDILEIDQDSEQPYGVSTQFAQIVFQGTRNKKINRYIPLDEIKTSLVSAIGDHCPVEEIIDQYIEDERTRDSKDPSRVFTKAFEKKKETLREDIEKYDIFEAEDLPYYEAGDTMSPELTEAVGKTFAFYRSTNEEDTYEELMKESPDERCRWLVQHNRSILIRDIDWEKIFDDIITCEDSFSRYYPMVRIKASSEGVAAMLRAFATNDELYSYAFELEKNSVSIAANPAREP